MKVEFLGIIIKRYYYTIYQFVARQYAYFYRLFANTLLKDYLTYDEYRWAVSTVMTRQNLVPGRDSQDPVNTLIPFWDLVSGQPPVPRISTGGF